MTKLTESQRRAIALAAVRAEKYGSITELAKRFNISRPRIYQIRDEYTDPEKLARLEDEVAFRRTLVGTDDDTSAVPSDQVDHTTHPLY